MGIVIFVQLQIMYIPLPPRHLFTSCPPHTLLLPLSLLFLIDVFCGLPSFHMYETLFTPARFIYAPDLLLAPYLPAPFSPPSSLLHLLSEFAAASFLSTYPKNHPPTNFQLNYILSYLPPLSPLLLTIPTKLPPANHIYTPSISPYPPALRPSLSHFLFSYQSFISSNNPFPTGLSYNTLPASPPSPLPLHTMPPNIVSPSHLPPLQVAHRFSLYLPLLMSILYLDCILPLHLSILYRPHNH